MDKIYKKYSTEDFITDESFIAWCKEEGSSTMWDSLAADDVIGPKMYLAKSMVLELSSITDHKISSSSKTQIWDRIDASTSNTKVISINNKLITYAIASVAACFLLLFAYNAIKSNTLTTQSATTILAANNIENHNLPDHSTVTIAKGSSVSYDKNVFVNKRTIHLNGHAFFKVQKGSEFNVVTDLGSIKVLGTSFDVIQQKNNLKVICYTGKVEVTSNGNKVILTPGEETDFNKPTFKKNALLHGEMPGYISGKLSFDQAGIKDLVKILEEEFDVTINANEEYLSKTYTGTIYLDNLDNALKSITWPYHLSFSKNGSEVTINKNEK